MRNNLKAKLIECYSFLLGRKNEQENDEMCFGGKKSCSMMRNEGKQKKRIWNKANVKLNETEMQNDKLPSGRRIKKTELKAK